MVLVKHCNDRKQLLLSIRERIRWDMERLTKIIRKLDHAALPYTSEDIIDEFRRYADEYTLSNYMEKHIVRLKRNGKIRTSETYAAALKSFRKFLLSTSPDDSRRQENDIMLDCIDYEVMEAYEAWQKKRGNSPNTISFYFRILRAVYNRAVEDDIIEDRNPFRHVYTGVDKTVKRALPLRIVKKIKTLDLSLTPALYYARHVHVEFHAAKNEFYRYGLPAQVRPLERLHCIPPAQDRSATHH